MRKITILDVMRLIIFFASLFMIGFTFGRNGSYNEIVAWLTLAFTILGYEYEK